MNREEYLDKVSDEFMSILHKYIPNRMIEGNGYSEMSFQARLSNKNNAFSKSQYYYKADNKFVHWTSVQNLMSIINYREMRLYNLHNSSDADEFAYAAEKLNLADNQIDYSKKYLYTLSFCKASELGNPDLWKDYGKNYEGVALEFEIVNNPNEWNNFMLSEVYYEVPKDFLELEKELNDFHKKYPDARTFIDLGKLIAFHKRPDFSKELEVRLSTYFPFNNTEAYEKFCNTEFRFEKGRPRETDYFGLKLWVNNESPFVKSDKPEFDRRLVVDQSYFVEKPQIRLTNIYFGKNCGISIQEFVPFWTKLKRITPMKLGYEIEDLALNLYG
ncbi:hypothetical protein MTsPCn9_10300 [Croceitalea sp. MTPC9]|uniref:DUF2971 domain-containing protein n=1 Tax=unclassified Croceitalea TaxID=2632280 RepID=UPI002B3BBBD8|nr:hypothetical protein MTsPCn6_26940 [Croceitalea sp. MTPC6]GMN16094.1 hypothetical protein MTsPCn9_10300 [Croceitalea sp. MTPC9]